MNWLQMLWVKGQLRWWALRIAWGWDRSVQERLERFVQR